MGRLSRATIVTLVGSTGLALGLMASSVGAQQASPLDIGQPDPLIVKKKAVLPVPPKPIGAAPAVTPAAQKPVAAAKPAAATTAQAKPAAAKPVATAAKPVAPAAKTVVAGAKPKPAKPLVAGKAAPGAKIAAAAKIPAGARMAIRHAAQTGQLTLPEQHQVSIPVTTECPGNPDALGVSRILKVDTTGGLYVGQTYSTRMPTLEPREVVLTFDDGPAAGRTDRVLAALDHECTKATFFIVGQMAKAYPETLRKTAAAGHTIAYHTMTHPLDLKKWPLEKAQDNIRQGWQTVDEILYGAAGDRPATPFFRYPGLFNSRPVNEWFNGMNMGVFAIDAAGNDWLKGYDGPKVMAEALKELEKQNGGVLLLHDIKDSSSSIVAPLLRELKVRGFKIVQIQPKDAPPPLVAMTASAGGVEKINPAALPTGPAPLKSRSIEGFDISQQLGQEVQGKVAKPVLTPLPAYRQPTAAVAAPAPLPVATATVDQTNSIQHAAAPVPAADDSWFGATASAFRGLGSSIGLW